MNNLQLQKVFIEVGVGTGQTSFKESAHQKGVETRGANRV
jgi:hypothetical protein